MRRTIINLKKVWLQGIIVLMLILVSISCTTSRINKPTVPDPLVNGVSVVVYHEDTDEVSMPRWYWMKCVNYIIDTQ